MENDSRLFWLSEKMEGWIYWSSVAISPATNTLYVGTSGIDGSPANADYTNALYAIDMSNGKVRWRYDLLEDHVVKGPVVIAPDGTIYFIAVDMPSYNAMGPGLATHLYAVNPDGTEKWKKLNISPVSPHFWGVASPAVDSEGNLYLNICVSATTPPTHALVALDPSGNEKWRYEFPGTERVVWPPPAVHGDTVYLMSCSGMFAISRTTGQLLWRNSNYALGDATPPVIGGDGTIYAGSGRNLIAYTPSGEIKWIFDAMAKILAPPVIGEDGTIYLGTTAKDMADPKKIAGYLWAIDPSTGREKWMFNIDPWMYDEYENTWKNADIYAPPVVGGDGTIYFTAEYRYVWALNPDGTLRENYDLNKFATGWPGGTVTYSALVLDENGILYKADSNTLPGTEKEWGVIIAIRTQSRGLANSPWPKGYRNYQNTSSG
jgi:outer membrane protein assembly factor BamB